MMIEMARIFQWPDSFHPPVCLVVKAGLGMSFVLATLCPPQWTPEVGHQNENLFQVSCQYVELGCKILVTATLSKTCHGCGQTFGVEEFPSKGRGRRESRCLDCHNALRRSRSTGRSREAVMAIKVIAGRFDERHEGLNDLLDLICSDILRKEVGS
ncbi:MAG: hypothetical protein IPK68_10075 [Bdellovibrionales bacterium]|nr:hypothetical protein [Bdellovibrionales bacterium]